MERDRYDIVVVGAGPAGSSAAKTAVEKGAKVIVLEEHPDIGIPRHCTGIFPDSSYSSEILEMVGESIILQKNKLIRIYGPSGKVIQEIPLGNVNSYVVRREEFDRAWARLAVNAGAELLLSTRATGLLKENGNILGVTTNSKDMPEVRGKLVIAAGGIHAMLTGITKQEGLTRGDEEYINGIQMQVTNVRDIEPGVIEVAYGYESVSPSHGSQLIVPLDENSCLISASSMADFKETKARSHPLCKKLRDAVPIRLMGFSDAFLFGRCLPKTIKDGLILVGKASGNNGMIPAVLSGRYAGEVAADAVQEGNIAETKLSRYEAMCKELGLDHEYDFWVELLQTVRRLPETALESALEEFVQQGKQLSFGNITRLPF